MGPALRRDLALLESFIITQVPSYANLRTPTIIVTGDRDAMVSPEINAHALAAVLPHSKVVTLKGVGHMPHHAAPEVVVEAIDELTPTTSSPSAIPDVADITALRPISVDPSALVPREPALSS